MPAGDFSPTTLPKILTNLNNIFRRPTTFEAEFMHPVETAKNLLQRQTVQVNEILEDGKFCKGVTAGFIQAGVSMITYSGQVKEAAYGCDPATGVQLQSGTKDYDNNLYIRATARVLDAKCDNLVTFQMESAKALEKCIVDIRKELNGYCINHLTGNVQPNQYTDFDTTIIGGASALGGNRLKIDPANFNEQALIELDLMAKENDIYDPIMINVGRNFYTSERIAHYKTGTGTDDGSSRIYNDFDIHWDLKGTSAFAPARRSTFIVNPNVMLFWNSVINGNRNPILKDSSKNKWVYSMSDPEFTYSRNGTLTPLVYDVRYVYTCVGTTTHEQEIYAHVYEVSLRGGLDIAPLGFNRAATPVAELTGVMEFVAEV